MAEASNLEANRPDITLYYLENSRSQRILWLLEELGVPYRLQQFRRNMDFTADAKLKQIHPLGKAPIVSVDGKVLAESGLIVDYLIDRFGPSMKPAGEQERLDCGYFSHFAEGSMMPFLLFQMVFSMIPAKSPWFAKPIAGAISKNLKSTFTGPNLKANFELVNQHLKQREYFSGSSISGADFMMSFPLEVAAARAGMSKALYPEIHAWLDRIHQRPAYKAALAKGLPYEVISSL